MAEKMVSMTDLEKAGWDKNLLYRIAHMPNSPFFRTHVNGKFYVIESKLIEFCSARRIGK